MDGLKIELSRACVASEYRSGIILHLLWRGLAEYVKLTDARYIFGLSSITHFDIRHLQSIYRFLLAKNSWVEKSKIQPRDNYAVLNLSGFDFQDVGDKDAFPADVPPLLESYLRAGAKVYGGPAWDQEFNCIDLFTIIDLRSTAKKYFKKYLV